MASNSNFFALVESRILETTGALFVETEEGRRFTYGDMLALTARYANALTSLGVVKGDRVTAQVDKSPEAYCLYLAVVRTGAIYLPLNTAYQSAELEYFLKDAEPRVFVCSPADERRKGELAAVNRVAHCLTLDEEGGGSLSELAASQPKNFVTAMVAADDVAAIIYTSGTTGRPKGAMLTHGNLANNGEALTKLWGFTADDVLLHALPLFHAHGLFISCHCALLSGSRVLFVKKFLAETLLGLLPRSTVMMGVPTFYTRLLDSPGFTAECVRGMRLFISGSAPLLAETSRQFTERTGHVILERYGMSESVIIASNPFQGERRIGTVGKPVEGVDVRIADGDDNPVPVGTMGGIQIRGTGVMKGYWRLPEKTAEEFTPDGWFRTGDLGVLSEDGYLSIVGRSKDLIISGGYNVYPKEVELAIDALPGVVESAVIGVPHRDYGEAVTAVVVRRDTTVTGETIIHTLKGRLASYKVPKQIHFVDELPRNPMGKVLKNALRDTYGRNGAAS